MLLAVILVVDEGIHGLPVGRVRREQPLAVVERFRARVAMRGHDGFALPTQSIEACPDHSSRHVVRSDQLDTALGIASFTEGTRFRVADLYDPEINVRYGSFYLRRLLRKYDDERLALAAYNAGQANVDEWVSEGGEIRFAETREYVEDVLEARDVYTRAYRDELGLG